MLGALIGAGASLLGGFMQSKQADKQAQMQKQFAQNGIQWKVKDAQKAGIHPIYALGAQTHSYAPQQVGDLGISAAGQDIARAVDTGATASERTNNILAKLQVERATLENQKLASEIALLRQPGHPPAPATPNAIIDGQGVPNQVETNPAKITSSMAPGMEAGAGNDTSLVKTPTGYAVVPSNDVKQRIEDMPLQEAQWAVRNSFVPPRPPEQAPKGYGWQYNMFTGEWTLGKTYWKYSPNRTWAK